MSHALRVICSEAVAAGFGLAGVPTRIASSSAEAAAALERLREDAAVGVVLVQDDLYAALDADTQRRLERDALPIVVPFPAPRTAEAPSAEDYLLELLRRAIGYRVRLR